MRKSRILKLEPVSRQPRHNAALFPGTYLQPRSDPSGDSTSQSSTPRIDEKSMSQSQRQPQHQRQPDENPKGKDRVDRPAQRLLQADRTGASITQGNFECCYEQS